MWLELKFAVRTLRRSPGFTLAALVCLACGVGVTTTIFSAVSGILLRPLPYARDHELIVVHARATNSSPGATLTAAEAATGPVSWAEYLAWRDGTRTLAGIGIWLPRPHELTGPEGPNERVDGAMVSANLLPLLGLQPMIGSGFPADAELTGTRDLVILSHALWQQRFGGDRAIVGRSIRVFNRAHTVVGIMPPGAAFPEGARLWTPINPTEEPASVHRYASAIGRLASTATLSQARAELTAIAREASTAPSPRDGETRWETVVVSLRDDLMGVLRRPVLIFQGAALLVLLIACANVANLMLARATVRQRDVAIRLALGAGQRRILQHVLLESLVLASAGGVLGTLLAVAGVRALALAFPNGVPAYLTLSIDPFVLAVTIAISLVTGVLFGVAPAIRAMHVTPGSALHQGGRGIHGGGSGGRLRQALVAAEIGVSLVLMIAATLLVRTDLTLEREVGFEGRGVLSVRVPLPYPTYVDARREAFFDELFARIRALPGVQAVGSTSIAAPLALPGRFRRVAFRLEGMTERQADANVETVLARDVNPGFLRALGVPIVRGRDFVAGDASPVGMRPVLVNVAFVRRYFGGPGTETNAVAADPIGRRITFWDATNRSPQASSLETFTIVGVVGNFRDERPPYPIGPAIYQWRPAYPGAQTLAVRTTLDDPLTLMPAIRAIVRDLDRSLVVYMTDTLDRTVAVGLWRQRLQANVLGLFAALALLLAVFGIYGVISYAVAQRTHELGVRLALGATRPRILALIVRQSASPAVVGLATGLTAALFLAPLLEGLLYDVQPTDPLTFASVSAGLALVALLAALVPARRAANVDPLVAIRHE